MCCCIHISSCPCVVEQGVCPSQMGGNAISNYCPYLAELRPQCHSIGGCICPNLQLPKVGPCGKITYTPCSCPGMQKIINAPGQASDAIYNAGVAAWCEVKKDFKKLKDKLPHIPWLAIGLVIFAMLLVVIFVYGYARSR